LTRKVTKVICRFIAAEYDEQGNLLAELPVAAGREEFNACLFFPFSDALTGLIAQIEEGLNAEEGTQDLQEGGSGERIRGYECSPGEPPSGGEEDGQEAADQNAGGPQGWEPAEHQPEEPEGDLEGGEHQEGADGGQQAAEACEPAEGLQQEEPALLIIEPGQNIRDQHNAAALIFQSMLEDGLKATLQDADAFVQSFASDPDKVCFVAYCGRQLAGCVVGVWHAEEAQPCYEVRNLYVLPQFRSKGVAQRLMQALLAWAYEDNAPIYITTQGEPRPFYRHLGFEPVREICGTTLATIRERLRISSMREGLREDNGEHLAENLQSGEVG
jgi:GNAT superfamily N-acetyltransferase